MQAWSHIFSASRIPEGWAEVRLAANGNEGELPREAFQVPDSQGQESVDNKATGRCQSWELGMGRIRTQH